jgi:hypothetical protein
VLLAVMGWSASSIGGVPLVAVYEPIVIAFISVVFGVQGRPVQVAAYRERRILRSPARCSSSACSGGIDKPNDVTIHVGSCII